MQSTFNIQQLLNLTDQIINNTTKKKPQAYHDILDMVVLIIII